MTQKRKMFTGYIEGYYGRLLSWSQRRSITDTIHSEGLNTYLYAPKEDIYHRQNWRIPYPEGWMQEFVTFFNHAEKKNITVIPSVSPGLSFDYTSEKDYSTLLGKYLKFIMHGVRTVAVLMDDIDLSLPVKSKKHFKSLGHAHGKLISRLKSDINKKYKNISIWFCPTVYCDSMAEENKEGIRYLKELKSYIPDNVDILWTGKDIVSEYIDKKSLSEISSIFGKNVIIWDNLYANDYCPSRFFCGALKNRKSSLMTSIKGYMLNPAGMLYTDSFILSLAAGFLQDRPPVKTWKAAAGKYKIPSEFSSVSHFFDSPFRTLKPRELEPDSINKKLNACKKLVFDWKGPLHREWYPYLFQLKCDLELFMERRKKKKIKKHDILKRYTSLQSYILKQL